MMQKLRIALGAIAALLLLSFIVQNFHTTKVNYWPFGKLEDIRVCFLMAGSAGLGVLAFYFFQAFRKSKKQP